MNSQKRKICFVVSSPVTVKSFLLDHIKALSEDFDIYLAGNFSEDDIAFLENLKLAGHKSIEIYRKINLSKDLASVLKLRRYLKQESFFATHSVTPKAGLITALAARMARVPYRIHIFTGQVWFTRTGLMKQLLVFLDRVIAGLNTHILVDGESQRQFLIDNRVLKESNSYVLGKGSISGVNTTRFNPDAETRLQLRNSTGVGNKVVFGFLGRLNKDKGINELYAAFDRLAGERDDVHLLFIGGDEENMLSLLPSFRNIKEGVNFTNFGYTNKPEEVLQALDVFCLPSYREGFGTSVLEASCLGIPVICSDTYGLMDAMVDGVTGLRHKVKDIDDLYCQMLKMAEDKELREQLGRNGRSYVLENFPGEVITGEWVRFYKSLK